MTNTPRIYLVTNVHEKSKKLVRAPSRMTAQRYVSAGAFDTRLATQDDIAELLTRGATIETVSLPVYPQAPA